ncbi:hypothetical protein VNO77_22059 [Canavalia gladiata]|uniref:Uncharacterized protein n=1 Tax=Canavalia gladiata TaxID=3824 RepID=A0AAN9Q7P3_CANGL
MTNSPSQIRKPLNPSLTPLAKSNPKKKDLTTKSASRACLDAEKTKEKKRSYFFPEVLKGLFGSELSVRAEVVEILFYIYEGEKKSSVV